MTTLVALSTKDCLVLGCDSLGSSSKKLVNPIDLVDYFDLTDSTLSLKLDKNGKPILKNFNDIYKLSHDVPFTHMPHMSKLFSLEPLEMALMITGVTSIGDRTIKSIIEEFKSKDLMFRVKPKPRNYSVETLAHKILDFVTEFYDTEHTSSSKPSLELILAGYGKRDALPEVYRIQFPDKKVVKSFGKGDFGIVLGGQNKEIQRIVFGTDDRNRWKIHTRHIELLREYRVHCNTLLKANSVSFEIPELLGEDIEKYKIFQNDWDLEGFDANWGDFSEQNAIECVDFLVSIMIKSQEFSYGMPTVGGEVHIALITKSSGVKFISKEEYMHKGHIVPKKI